MRLTSNMLSIVGCLITIIATYYVYKAAKKSNHNMIGWAALTFSVGFGFQIIIPLLIAFTFSLIMVALKRPFTDVERIYSNYGLIMDTVFLTLNFGGIWLIIRQVSKISEDKISVTPPPPPTFDER